MSINITRDSPKSVNVNNSIKESNINFTRSVEQNNNTSNNINTNDNFEDGLKYMMNVDAKNKTYEEQQETYEDPEYYGRSASEEEIEDENEETHEIPEVPQMSYEELEREKAKYLSKLKRLSKNPSIECRRLNSSHTLEEIKGEVFRAEKDQDAALGLNYYKEGLKFLTLSIDYGSSMVIPSKPLDGWSNAVYGEIDDCNYDSVLEELYEKYGISVASSPEIRLFCMLGASGLSYYTNKSRVDFMYNGKRQKSKMRGPSDDTDEILKRLAEEEDKSSVSSYDDSPAPKPKKRGRPKKT